MKLTNIFLNLKHKIINFADMKKTLLFIITFSAFWLSACTDKPKYVIHGTVPPDRYNGEKIYLVPAEGANWGNVDSTIIQNNSFTFEGDTERVWIVRMPIRLRIGMQEMLVVSEPGEIHVNIGPSSSVDGTPQNRWLQQWKNTIDDRQKAVHRLFMARRNSNEDAEAQLKDTSLIQLRDTVDSLNRRMEQTARRLIKEHKGTTLANFMQKVFNP